MKGPLATELALVVAAAGIGLTAGYLIGYPLLGLAAGLVFCVIRHLRNLLVLGRSLDGDGGSDLEIFSGLWGRTFRRLAAERSVLRAEAEELRLSRDRYKLVTKALPEAAVTIRSNGRIDMVNEAAVRLLDLKDPEDIGQPIVNFIRDPRFADLLSEASSASAIEVSSLGNPSTRLSLRVVPYGVSEKRLLLAQDVTRLTRLEQIRRDFIANVSHELKSPLTVIIGYVEWLQDDKSMLEQLGLACLLALLLDRRTGQDEGERAPVTGLALCPDHAAL